MSDKSTTDDTVIPVDFGAGERVPVVRTKSGGACTHYNSRFVIHERNATVECLACGQIVDAIVALKACARMWDRQDSAIRSLERRRSDLSKEVEDLKRLKKNLQAQMRRRRR